MITRDFSVISIDVTGVSLSLSLSLYDSQKSLTHNIGSASALPIIRVWVRDGASGPGPDLVHTLCCTKNSDATFSCSCSSSFPTLSSSPVASSCKNLSFFSDGSWIFRLANGCFFFFFQKKSCATGGQTLRKPGSRSTCTAHRMCSHCCPQRNQHC